ncbi:MAG: YicC/YloC family endoribonuclease [Candidatus Arsenophonus melophagi]|nr:YicC/YloC family endoribonuclease [Candidatus Arsenophonus melophagi]
MINSMTAFTRRDIKSKWGNAAWELRSVNQRYLETSIRLPEQFSSLEPIIRECLRARLVRGKVECSLRFELSLKQQSELILNEELATQLIKTANWVKKKSGEGVINPLEILRWSGVMVAQKKNLDVIYRNLLKELDFALDDFILNRESEGRMLKIMIEKRLDAVSQQIQAVRNQMPEILKYQRERLQTKLAKAEIQIDNNRLEQELIMLAQRIDVDEELDRLDAHVKETRNMLHKQEAVGRRLDFMMQELNREANTLASKSINSQVTNSVIELKVLIEQMREQIQNIE